MKIQSKYKVISEYTMHYDDRYSRPEKITSTSVGTFDTLGDAEDCIECMRIFADDMNSECGKLAIWIKRV